MSEDGSGRGVRKEGKRQEASRNYGHLPAVSRSHSPCFRKLRRTAILRCAACSVRQTGRNRESAFFLILLPLSPYALCPHQRHRDLVCRAGDASSSLSPAENAPLPSSRFAPVPRPSAHRLLHRHRRRGIPLPRQSRRTQLPRRRQGEDSRSPQNSGRRVLRLRFPSYPHWRRRGTQNHR